MVWLSVSFTSQSCGPLQGDTAEPITEALKGLNDTANDVERKKKAG